MCSGERLSQLGNERADRIATAFLLSKDVMRASKKDEKCPDDAR